MTTLVALAMLADLVTFALVVPIVGIGAELNPVMAQGYAQAGILAVAALKCAALAAIVLLVARVHRPRLRHLAAGIAIAVGLTGTLGNTTAWVAATSRSALDVSPPARTEAPTVTRHLATVTPPSAIGTRPAPTEEPRTAVPPGHPCDNGSAGTSSETNRLTNGARLASPKAGAVVSGGLGHDTPGRAPVLESGGPLRRMLDLVWRYGSARLWAVLDGGTSPRGTSGESCGCRFRSPEHGGPAFMRQPAMREAGPFALGHASGQRGGSPGTAQGTCSPRSRTLCDETDSRSLARDPQAASGRGFEGGTGAALRSVTPNDPQDRTREKLGRVVRGIATWFNSPSGVSAAGPDLRAALGPGWRGRHVAVTANGRTVVTTLGDTMAADRLIDLDAPLFARLAPLSVGVLAVTLVPIPAPPVTSMR